MFRRPHRLSVSHTLLVQTSEEAAAVHVPFSVGLTCGASVGSAVPFASVGVHAEAVSLHQLPALQSVSSAQPIFVVMCHVL